MQAWRAVVRVRFQYIMWVPIAILLFSCNSASADGVPPGYRMVGIEERVPADLLYAIARSESKARHGSRLQPWPWTLNVRGRAMYFSTRAAAHHELVAQLCRGEKSVDVGLMQVHWRYHEKRLGYDPWKALDPYFNMRAGARYLRELYEKHGDWWTAVMYYHSPNKVLGNLYKVDVAHELTKIRAEGGTDGT